MKERELREHATCSLCRQKIGHTGLPLFWAVRIERYGIDAAAVQRQQGLAMMLGGNGALALAMGPDEEMTMPMMDPVTLTVCERCAVSGNLPVAALAEVGEPAQVAPGRWGARCCSRGAARRSSSLRRRCGCGRSPLR